MNILDDIKSFDFSGRDQFLLIAGPCVVENREMVMRIAGEMAELCDQLKIPYVFKASYRKANRSSIESFTGIGDEKALEILQEAGEKNKVPVTTDIHAEAEASMAAKYVDILQIPAFLCRQTSLLLAAGKTGKVVNIKKGQFMGPQSMGHTVEKVRSTRNEKIWLTERGTTFGYQDLVVDFRNVPIMRSLDVPVIVDCTHSLQKPNQAAGVTGGDPSMIGTVARAALATGADGLFIETHPEPAKALSDGANMLPMQKMEALLKVLAPIYTAAREQAV